MTSKMGRPKAMTEDKKELLNNDEYYTIDELVKILKISRRTIERHIKSGEIKALKIGKQWRIRKSDIQWDMKLKQYFKHIQNATTQEARNRHSSILKN